MSTEPTIEQRIEAVFGQNRHFLILAAIGSFGVEPPEPFYLRQISQMTETSANRSESYVWKRFQRLQEAGMIELALDQSGKTKPYIRRDMPEWAAINSLAEFYGLKF